MGQKETLEFLIKDEIEAVKGYDKAILDDPENKALYSHIKEEENTHIHELLSALLVSLGLLKKKGEKNGLSAD